MNARGDTLNAGIMQRALGMLVCALLLNASAVTAQIKLEDNVDQAVTILERFREIPEQAIPEAVGRGNPLRPDVDITL